MFDFDRVFYFRLVVGKNRDLNLIKISISTVFLVITIAKDEKFSPVAQVYFLKRIRFYRYNNKQVTTLLH